ncbi:5-carboxymethyl-2-hydroxymuconate Delta-isomerase [Streptomyces sp. 130]|uniref:5-carboxymethyl-2-hydroxymuconate Delta-isomerase n=1 Tax=Streptomyces sp. 130 TaxID=2591006 RepID=UPI00117E8D1A|nr:5-carboxymethyl-2-hydroxymuconate Delta-isomerase [Streptomyces sp. 130]TRV72402.1 5-carboxymethyl-2-hydroxymuconate Delta-isomerase [Streptomyces sp. 130]
MPQITVDYSAELAGAFDRPAFALALHPVVAATVDTKTAACKTRFRRAEETVVGDAPAGDALVHVDISLLPGRTPQTKARLTEAVLELLRDHVGTVTGLTPHLSAEVRDLDPSYRKV